MLVSLREASLFTGWGEAGNNGNRYNSRKSPFLRKIFFTRPFIFPKGIQNNRRAKNVRPPLMTPRNFFAPP